MSEKSWGIPEKTPPSQEPTPEVPGYEPPRIEHLGNVADLVASSGSAGGDNPFQLRRN